MRRSSTSLRGRVRLWPRTRPHFSFRSWPCVWRPRANEAHGRDDCAKQSRAQFPHVFHAPRFARRFRSPAVHVRARSLRLSRRTSFRARVLFSHESRDACCRVPFSRTARRPSSKSFLYCFAPRRVLLRVNHDTLQRVDRSQRLWIFRLDDVFLFGWFRVVGIAEREEHALLLCRHGNPNIRRHPISLNDLFARRVVFCRGKANRGTVWQLHDILHGTFSERGFANEDGAMQILERSGNDLRTTRAAFVDQERHGKRRTLFSRPRGRIIVLLGSNSALG